MPRRRYSPVWTLFLALMLVAVSCSTQQTLPPGESLQLAAYTDSINGIAVLVRLNHATDGTFQLTATFTPPAGYHLYSKDIPRAGVRGQGRPTLLELPPQAKMQSTGTLTASAAAYLPGYVPDGASIYPPGPVTLTLPVKLPDQTGWVEDVISLTYTACTEIECLAPTVGKIMRVRIPGGGSILK